MLQLTAFAKSSDCIVLVAFPQQKGVEDAPLCIIALLNKPLDTGESK